MMQLFKYIGTVSAKTRHIEGGRHFLTTVSRWVLLVGPFGWRRAKFIGDKDWGMSQNAQEMKHRVIAWRKGGPLPPLDEDTKHRSPAPVLKIMDGGKN